MIIFGYAITFLVAMGIGVSLGFLVIPVCLGMIFVLIISSWRHSGSERRQLRMLSRMHFVVFIALIAEYAVLIELLSWKSGVGWLQLSQLYQAALTGHGLGRVMNKLGPLALHYFFGFSGVIEVVASFSLAAWMMIRLVRQWMRWCERRTTPVPGEDLARVEVETTS